MRNLILDQGNTYLKAAVVVDREILRQETFKEYSETAMHRLLDGLVPDAVILSSVAEAKIADDVRASWGNSLYELDHKKPIPFQSKYLTPHTLGLDRIALAAAAVSELPNKNCLIIDAGTCITIDFIDSRGVYHGGSIAPGLMMRYKSLEHFTAKLPLVEHKLPKDLIGDSTNESIRSGVVNGTIAEVSGTIQRYQERFPDVQVVITGGDLQVFEPLLKNGIFAAPNFLLKGLNYILEYYAEVL